MALKDLVRRGPAPKMAMPAKRAPRHSRDPQHISEETWYYEEPKGLLIVHEMRTDDGKYIRTDQFTIPWRSVRSSLMRHENYDPVGDRPYRRSGKR